MKRVACNTIWDWMRQAHIKKWIFFFWFRLKRCGLAVRSFFFCFDRLRYKFKRRCMCCCRKSQWTNYKIWEKFCTPQRTATCYTSCEMKCSGHFDRTWTHVSMKSSISSHWHEKSRELSTVQATLRALYDVHSSPWAKLSYENVCELIHNGPLPLETKEILIFTRHSSGRCPHFLVANLVDK